MEDCEDKHISPLNLKEQPKSKWDDEDVDENDVKESWEDEDEPAPSPAPPSAKPTKNAPTKSSEKATDKKGKKVATEKKEVLDPLAGKLHQQSIMCKDKVRASWNMNTTKVLIDLCIEQVKKGRRKYSSFTKIGWNDISDGFTTKTRREYSRMQLKNKYDSLRKDWQMWDRLHHETGMGWDNDRKNVIADNDWWEKKIMEVPGYNKFRLKGLQFQDELAQLFGNVEATGPHQWTPSNMTLPTDGSPEIDLQEGFGDSDEILGATTGIRKEFNSVTFNQNSRGSASNNNNGKGTSVGDRTTRGCRITSSLGVKRRGVAMKKKRSSSAKIVDSLNMMAEEARATRMAAEARFERMAAKRAKHAKRTYEISITGVMCHLNQVNEVVSDIDFHVRCANLFMNHPPAREKYAALKHMKDKLLVFLRHECYGNNK